MTVPGIVVSAALSDAFGCFCQEMGLDAIACVQKSRLT